jgi:CDP-6-deoxy-D-xylo-4-hexulose-3-dehydrase
LPRLDAVIEKRCNNLKVWLENLDSEYFFTNFIEQGNSNFSLPLILKSPNEKTFQKICKKINELSIEYRKGTAGGGSQANQPYLKNYNYKISGDLTNVNHIHNFGLYIGNHCDITPAHVKKLCKTLNDLVKS